ncbi:hypothetical protein SAMN04488082_108110 [Desulfomicrobium apsheronum]|uniref:Amino acid transporter, AAT family n=1 Tax=Desulfomicrobium apsheronum TaxID=52560 RepID=A0A1I3UTS0_9BACT|nr:hypothetical protein [Desulfomicrobium apsheronum]SFJ86029.1 hypothetical protein SAMN04488082_108110 [Desulfomicrobium apsheronum]
MSKSAHMTLSVSPDATDTSPNTMETNLFFSGALNLALILLVAQACWYLVFSPEGPVRLYTPNVGVSFVITILMVIHWGVDVFDYWPFNRRWLNESPSVIRGTVLLTTYILVGFFVMFVFYYQMLGMYGPVFFSGPGLLSGGGLGQYPQTATENACFAQVMMNTCIIFFTMLWLTTLGFRPWASLGRFARGLGVFFAGLVLAILAFSVLFFPHIAYQFYPAQIFMGAKPWWIDQAMTMSSQFHFGWIVPALVLLYWTHLLWEGRPWSCISNPGNRTAVMTVSVLALGYMIMIGGNMIMDWWWDLEAFEGGATLENPAWRWNHIAEMAMFCHAAAFILANYFHNWPNVDNVALRAVLRSAIAIVGGLALSYVYYELGPLLLGTVPGIAQEGDTTLAWTVMFLILMFAHQKFFRGWPFQKR